LESWFDHYNTVHPHKSLGYRSPREFRAELRARKETECSLFG
ncbi:MAG: transposase, partial [Acetobacteraceae bacterium]|nr:transposase [Acetobacteraceae bacterium]